MNKLIKFEASWCAPCKAYTPIFKQVTENNGMVESQVIDIDNEVELTQKYNIRSVPTTILVNDDGEELGRVVGMVNAKNLEEFIKEHNEL